MQAFINPKYIVSCLFLMFFAFSISCKKDEQDIISFEKGTLTDIDNNVYQTIKIGNQWWMAENLKVKTFRNGTPISQHQTNESWEDSLPSFCLFDNTESAPGLLYNWFAINSSDNIAPAGWHLPSDSEWQELEKYLGMSAEEAGKKGWRGDKEGDKLKSGNTTGWISFSDVWSNNSSGFDALAGGCRLFNGVWANPGLFATGFWWTNSESSDEGQAYYRYLDYKKSSIYRSICNKKYGFSVRCVKD